MQFRPADGGPAGGFAWVDEEPILFGAQPGLEGVQGPLLLSLAALSMQQLSQMLYVPAPDQVFTVHPATEQLKALSAPQRMMVSCLLESLLRGPIFTRSVDDEMAVAALEGCVVQDVGGAYSLTALGKALVSCSRVLHKSRASRLSAYRHDEPGTKTRWELLQQLGEQGWSSHTVVPRRRKAIKDTPYRCDAGVEKHFFVEEEKLPFKQYLLALLLCAPGKQLESQSIPHLQTQRYYQALLEGKDPKSCSKTRTRKDRAAQAGLDLLAEDPIRNGR